MQDKMFKPNIIILALEVQPH